MDREKQFFLKNSIEWYDIPFSNYPRGGVTEGSISSYCEHHSIYKCKHLVSIDIYIPIFVTLRYVTLRYISYNVT